MSWPYMYLEKDGVLLSNVREDGRRDWVLIQSPDSNVGTLTAGHIVSMLVAEPGMDVVDVFTPIALECANNGKVNWRGLSISAPDASAADADCERHWVARGMKSKAGTLMIRSADYIAYIHHEHRAEPIDGTAPTKKISAHYCSGGSQSSDCTRVLHELLRPLAPRIQAIIDGQRRQYAEGLPWLTARYAPLEAERLTQWRALAARYATRPRPAVGTLTPRPVAKSPAKKGRRN